MKYVPCNLCGADNWRVLYCSTLSVPRPPSVEAFRCTSAEYGEHAQIVRCHNCGHIYANPTWESAELIDAYSAVEDGMYLAERSGRELTFRKHLHSLEAHLGSPQGRRLLDVGAYIGVFVDVARVAGWDAVGLEPSHWAVEIARGQRLPMIAGTLDAPELAGAQFDLITLWDVIEHLEDPRGELERAFDLLAPGGGIVVHTMNIESPIARLMGRRWPWLMAMHVQYFSRRTLTRLMREIGFQVLAAPTEGRYLRLGYLASRLTGLSAPLGRLAGWLIRRLGWSEVAVPINFGDLITVYAVRPWR